MLGAGRAAAARRRACAPSRPTSAATPPAPARGRGAYRVEELVADAAALVEVVRRGSVHVVGHDWGAVVAWTLAALRPELVRTVTAVSVPHPAAFLRAMSTSRRA